eukprot:m.307507 g.307507  ORF g.307507 m.307507 type:complete len:490 (+) comp55317_c1_seq2:1541-3010(+)
MMTAIFSRGLMRARLASRARMCLRCWMHHHLPFEISFQHVGVTSCLLVCFHWVSFWQQSRAREAGTTVSASEGATATTAVQSSKSTASTEGDEPGISVAILSEVALSSSRLTLECAQEAHYRCVKLMNIRSKDGIDDKLSTTHFMEFYDLSMNFIGESEKMIGQSIPVLRNAMTSQAKKFLDRFHSQRREKIEQTLLCERWEPMAVPQVSQQMVNKFISSTQPPTTNSATGETGLYLTIGAESVRPISALILFLHSIDEYFLCASSMPAMAAEVAARLVDSIRVFNLQLNKLILKAEAIKVANLRTITAKHLALSVQSLTGILALLPHIKEGYASLLPHAQQIRLNDFDSVEADLLTHRREIFEKLTSIMLDIWNRSAKDFNWGKESPTTGARAIVDRTVKLHAAILGVMSLTEIRTLFREILAVFNRKFHEAALQRDRREKAGISADIVYFEEQLAKLDGVVVSSLRNGLPEIGLVLPSLVTHLSLAP